MQQYSVLMSVYAKEEPAHFRAAIESMLRQTVPTDDFVVVCDGPLTEELDRVLEEAERTFPGIVHPVRLERNMGIGYAANAGLQACRHELIAKMDADDISVPDRCRQQLALFEKNPELAVCGGYIEEFETDPDKPFAMRTVPLEHQEILKFGRRRSPFSNMTVMYRRSAVLAVGGYSDLRRNEDYDLHARLLAGGYRGENLPVTLVKVRVDQEAHRRRNSVNTLKGCIHSRWRAYRMGYARLGDFLYCVAGQLFVVLCPATVQKRIYATFFRKKCTEPQAREEHCESITNQP